MAVSSRLYIITPSYWRCSTPNFAAQIWHKSRPTYPTTLPRHPTPPPYPTTLPGQPTRLYQSFHTATLPTRHLSPRPTILHPATLPPQQLPIPIKIHQTLSNFLCERVRIIGSNFYQRVPRNACVSQENQCGIILSSMCLPQILPPCFQSQYFFKSQNQSLVHLGLPCKLLTKYKASSSHVSYVKLICL